MATGQSQSLEAVAAFCERIGSLVSTLLPAGRKLSIPATTIGHSILLLEASAGRRALPQRPRQVRPPEEDEEVGESEGSKQTRPERVWPLLPTSPGSWGLSQMCRRQRSPLLARLVG